MTQTVIGIFDTPDAAHAAEEALLGQGIEQSCLHLASQENASGIRSFLSDLFGPDNPEEADGYAEAIEHGGALLSVDLPDDAEIQPIQETMQDAGAMDLEDLMEQWRQEESAEFSEEEESAPAESGSIPVVEEEMEIGKTQTGKGKVRVVSRTVETPVEEEVNLKEERATIKRRPVDRSAGPEDLEQHGEQSFEVEETAEKPVVSKSARVVEEIEVGKETSEKTQVVGDTVRHTEVDVERQQASPGGKRKGGKK